MSGEFRLYPRPGIWAADRGRPIARRKMELHEGDQVELDATLEGVRFQESGRVLVTAPKGALIIHQKGGDGVVHWWVPRRMWPKVVSKVE